MRKRTFVLFIIVLSLLQGFLASAEVKERATIASNAKSKGFVFVVDKISCQGPSYKKPISSDELTMVWAFSKSAQGDYVLHSKEYKLLSYAGETLPVTIDKIYRVLSLESDEGKLILKLLFQYELETILNEKKGTGVNSVSGVIVDFEKSAASVLDEHGNQCNLEGVFKKALSVDLKL